MNKISEQVKCERWLAHVNAWRQSGQTQTAYCDRHEIALGTFSGWVARAKKMLVRQAEPLTMVPVVVQSLAAPVQLSSSLRLQHSSGWQLELPATVAADWVGKMLKELG